MLPVVSTPPPPPPPTPPGLWDFLPRPAALTQGVHAEQPASTTLFSLSSLFVGIINEVKLFCTDYLRLESIVISISDFLNFFLC